MEDTRRMYAPEKTNRILTATETYPKTCVIFAMASLIVPSLLTMDVSEILAVELINI